MGMGDEGGWGMNGKGEGEERKRKTGVGDSRGGEGKKGGSGLWWLCRVYADT